ncbi:MAG: UDP-N-acetylmuramoyl-tripeptide--D-alanyl-D-alanine ligase, partial [Planctomycetota bacterium]|nr:UDP-N-acetylmuramoyl-tripeptide--D-alanyl-D-alanine ligase [Planctomycetota bacterium]
MSFWSVESIKSALGATFFVRAASLGPVERVSIDSRTTGSGSVFIAIKGEKTDGHGFLAQAVAGGATLLIVHDTAAVSRVTLPPSVSVLQVQETGAALLKLAAAYRRTLETTRVIAVGGSNGKTTTCKLLQGVLASQFRGTASPKSFNNAIGVPLTILSARRGDQYLICEVGTNSPGEIAPLAAVIEPDIAVITSIGREHLEGLGSISGVIAEEATLLSSLRPGGTAVVTAECPELLDVVKPMVQRRTMAGVKGCTLLTFGRAAGADLRVADIAVAADSTTFTINQRERYSVLLPGAHNACNAAAVIAVARRMGMTQSDIERALAAATGPDMRMQRSSIA